MEFNQESLENQAFGKLAGFDKWYENNESLVKEALNQNIKGSNSMHKIYNICHCEGFFKENIALFKIVLDDDNPLNLPTSMNDFNLETVNSTIAELHEAINTLSDVLNTQAS
jgi:hypothetical protein